MWNPGGSTPTKKNAISFPFPYATDLFFVLTYNFLTIFCNTLYPSRLQFNLLILMIRCLLDLVESKEDARCVSIVDRICQ